MCSLANIRNAIMICRWLLEQAAPLAASRARRRAGIRIEISSAITPITTSSSTSVKARLERRAEKIIARRGGGGDVVIILRSWLAART